MVKDLQLEKERLYQQILDALEELAHLHATTDEDMEEEGGTEGIDVLESIVEEAGERGLDEEAVERVIHAVSAFERKSQVV